MQVLLNPIGTIGDVHPYLGLASVLRERGHQVTVIANPYYEQLVGKIGLDFVPLGTTEDLEGFWRDPRMWQAWSGWRVALDWTVIRPMRQAYEIIADRYVRGDTVVAGPGWAFGARIAQDHLGIPMATLHLGADKFQSVYESPKMPPPMWLPDWLPRPCKASQFWLADRLFSDPILGPPTNTFRAELGLPPVKRLVGRWWHSPTRIIGLFPAWFSPPQPDWPKQTVMTGFPLWDQGDNAEVSAEMQHFIESGDPPLVFTFGTANQHARQFFQAASEACRLLGRRGVMITKYRQDLPDELPQGVRHFPYVRFSYLLPRSAALIHHAGTGTTAQGLAAGLPQLVTPMTFGQPHNGMRLVRLGVARALTPRTFRAARVAKELEYLLNSPTVASRCQQLAAHFQNSQPLERTCELLEELAGTDLRKGDNTHVL
jgi:UDP:flavonoid glycosyltransferase YjiC (YdhE family)